MRRAVELEVLPPFERIDLLPRKPDDARDERERKRVRLAADLCEHRAQDRKRDGKLQLKGRAESRDRRDTHGAADVPDHVLHGIQADTAAGDVRDPILQRKSRQEQEFEQLSVGQRVGRFGIDELSLDHTRAQALQVDATSVVGDHDVEVARAVMRLDSEKALGPLAGRAPLFGRFDAVIEGVAEKVAERRLELSENVAIDLRRLSRYFQLHLLAKRAGQIAHKSRKPLHAIAEWAHPAGKGFAVQTMREVHRAAIELIEVGEPIRQQPARSLLNGAASHRARPARVASSACSGSASRRPSSERAVS